MTEARCPKCGSGQWPLRDGDGESVYCMMCGRRIYRPLTGMDRDELMAATAQAVTPRRAAYLERCASYRREKAAVGARLTAARKRLNITAAEMARRLCVPLVVVRNYEQGKNAPSTEATVGRIVAEYGVPRETLWHQTQPNGRRG